VTNGRYVGRTQTTTSFKTARAKCKAILDYNKYTFLVELHLVLGNDILLDKDDSNYSCKWHDLATHYQSSTHLCKYV